MMDRYVHCYAYFKVWVEQNLALLEVTFDLKNLPSQRFLLGWQLPSLHWKSQSEIFFRRIVLIILFFYPSGISALLCLFLSVSRAKARASRGYFCSKFFAITIVFIGLTTSVVALKEAIWKICCRIVLIILFLSIRDKFLHYYLYC